MRLVTRCPACATTFKVVRDQLRISDGWVRCGRCSEVFDATLDLQETDDDGVPLNTGAPAQGAVQPAPGQLPQDGRQPPPAGTGLPAMTWPAADLLDLGARPVAAPAPSTSLPARPPVSSSFNPDEDPVPIPSLDDDLDDGDGSQEEPWFEEMMASTQALQAAFQSSSAPADSVAAAPDARRKDPSFTPSLTTASPIEDAVNAQLQKALRRERIKALRVERAQQKEHERAQQAAAARGEAPTQQEVSIAPEAQAVLPETPLLEAPSAPASFVDDAGDTSVRPNRSRKLVLALGCALALVVLLLQVVLEERNALVAREPRLRPVLESLCDLSGCQVSALRQINSITIEGASFSREKEGDGYRLVFALRNGARVPLAMPSIELTLLDTQERALVRRVLSPAQFGAGPVLGPGAESSTSLPVQLSGSEAAGLGPVAGYNLVAFYP
ncbi:MAG: DUF3426 domain-containing protein [Proteobacteria bacterium]|nr:DUF3426 domain-containing protein [Pseudomonadota bacterium]